MTDFDAFKNELLQDSEVRHEYDELEPEFDVIQAIINARKASGFSQKELSEKTGIAQGDISRIETGNANPSMRTLQKLAFGMGMKVKLEFIPL